MVYVHKTVLTELNCLPSYQFKKKIEFSVENVHSNFYY